jgi:two-component system, cell cycle sensor histidine kinase and response regulator CckA
LGTSARQQAPASRPRLDLSPDALALAATQDAPDQVLVLDAELKIRYVNFTTVDVTPDEVLGVSALDFLSRADAARFLDASRRVAETQASARFEVGYRQPSGEVAMFPSHLGPIVRGGEVVGFVLITGEGTEGRRAEDDLRRSEEYYRSLIEDQEEFVVRWLPDGTRTFVNYAYCRYFGGERRDLLDTNLFPLILAEDLELVRREIAGLSPQDPVRSGEHRVIRRDGSVGWTEWVDRGFFDGRGQLFELQSVGRDITERKAAEEALRASEERYRTVFEEAKDAVFESTPEGRLVDINAAGVELFGYASREELLAIKDIGRELYFQPRDRERVARRLAARGYVKNEELVLRRRDGTKITALESASAVRDEEGRVVAYRGMLHDISERLRLERRLRQAERLESVGKLAGGVAHDFNNLLTVIVGNAELLLEELSAEDPRRRPLEEICGAASRANTLTSRLLAFGRRQVLIPEVMNLNEVVGETQAMLGRLIGEDIELTTDLEMGLGSVRADPGQIQQVLLNLAFNARDAMPNGGTLSIATENADWAPNFNESGPGRQGGAWVRLTVTDTGVGIPREHQERIFEPFFTTKEPERGTGLGLASVYGIVKQSGGYITVSSDPGGGARFEVFLPYVDATPRPRRRRRALAHLAAPGHGRVMLVEDEAGLRELASRIFQHAGYEVISATNGEEALEMALASKAPIDLLVTDIVMPKMGGFELVERLTQALPNLKVLFVTGHSDEAVKLRSPIRGYEILKKPFSPRELLERSRVVMEAPPGSRQ